MPRASKLTAAVITAAVAGVAALPAAGSAAPSAASQWGGSTLGQIKHVLLLSVDGMHQSDLRWYVRTHPASELAKLTAGGSEYSHAQTPVPSDSDPGMTAQMTGGNPRTTGVYYDVEYNHKLFPPGTTSCTGTPPGSPWSTTRRMTSTPPGSTPDRASPACPARSCR